ncbi:hypothetical protein NXY00_20520 [Bacteroides sp. BFG-551]|nr:hypothetical protein [Bacteroides sp. BFG-551]
MFVGRYMHQWLGAVWRQALSCLRTEVVRYGFTFEQLYINGRRATLARTPNEDWYTVKDASETSFVNGVRAADYAVQRVVLNTQDISSLKGLTADEASRVKFRFYHKWDITQKHIEYADADSGFVYLAGKGMQDWNPITAGSRYVMFNYMKALDEPGEWYLGPSDRLYLLYAVGK